MGANARSFRDKSIHLYQIQDRYPTTSAIQKHPDLIPYLKSHDPPRIDNTNKAAMLLYNYYITRDLYGLDLQFHPKAIIPTPMLRYNFLKHVLIPQRSFRLSFLRSSQLKNPRISDPSDPQTILELGTGASAMIALLAVKHFGTYVYATELDPSYIVWAKKNIQRNRLDSKIEIVESQGKMITGLFPSSFQVDVILSNPPYYDQMHEENPMWGGQQHELVSKGDAGERFIVQMIQEGWPHLKQYGILAFMVPKTRRSTLKAVERFLDQHSQIWDYDIIGLIAGNRTRYIFRIYKISLSDFSPAFEMN